MQTQRVQPISYPVWPPSGFPLPLKPPSGRSTSPKFFLLDPLSFTFLSSTKPAFEGFIPPQCLALTTTRTRFRRSSAVIPSVSLHPPGFGLLTRRSRGFTPPPFLLLTTTRPFRVKVSPFPCAILDLLIIAILWEPMISEEVARPPLSFHLHKDTIVPTIPLVSNHRCYFPEQTEHTMFLYNVPNCIIPSFNYFLPGQLGPLVSP